MKPLPLFPVSTVGSWPRPQELLRALRRKQQGQVTAEEFSRIADAAVLEALRCQESAGIDLVTDGEQRRDNFYSFVAEKLDGVRLMSLAEMLDVVEDKAGFERILQTLDVPAFSIQNPTCVGRISLREPLALDEYCFLRQHTNRPIKVPLPGPYLLTRAMWVKEVSRAVYPSKEDLAEDVVAVLRQEAFALRDAGVDFIQFDEPVLTELVFTQGQTRTFMCAALAARKDPAEELEFAVALINRVVAGLDGVRTGLHICRGNWSQREETLLSGSYHPLLPYLARINVQQLVLEYATPRAGELLPVTGKELGLGVVNPRTADVEAVEGIVERVREALRLLPPENIFLNPDCGFGTFSRRPMNSLEIATKKLEAMVEAATVLRREFQDTSTVRRVAGALPGNG
ncbi:MAG: vitamin-B12 independent methionine synthase [Acidobacteria bacterium RIFCSPLOWO2_02_FULL_61_28]|nr:MAG: vitamin-B12 independent methionine synthase [Acidobacteria bacterium RIFCSPLOWO2_02_FULL_61_28]